MRLPEWDHQYKELLTQNEFNEEDAARYVAIKSGYGETSADYQKRLKSTLLPDIDTCVYQGHQIDEQFVMRRKEGKRLFSIQAIQQWMVRNSIEVAEEFRDNPLATKFSTGTYKRKSNYLTVDALEKLSRKATLSMEEVVQIIHIRTDEKEFMADDMLDTWDTINRHLVASGTLLKENSQAITGEILTIAACLFYPIPCQLVNWLQLPIEGINWPNKSKTSEKNNRASTDSFPDENLSDRKNNKRELRIEEIEKAAKKHFDNPLCIPTGGKAELRRLLCDQNPKLFSESTFDKAWKQAKKGKLVEVENVEKYKPYK